MHKITEMPNCHDLRTCALAMSGEEVRVDRKARTIYGVSLMQIGPLNDDRPWEVDLKTLEQALALMLANGPQGTKGRYTHPNMSTDGLGSFLGRWVNPRIDNDRLRADLVLSERAFSGPRGDIGTYLLDMAESDADMLGVSLATRMNRKAMKSDSNAKGIEPIRLSAIRAADVVDEPAATRGGLFSTGAIDELPEHATRVLDHYFEAATPDVVRARVTGFLDRYLTNRYGDPSAMSTNTAPQPNGDDGQPAGDHVTKADLGSLLESFGTSLLAKVDEKLAKLGDMTPDEKPGEEGQLSVAEAVANERKRCTDLQNLAKSAGLKDAEKVAVEWIDKNFSLVDAKGALADKVIKQNLLSQGEGDDGADDQLDTKLKAEFRSQAKVHGNLGVTEDEYVEFRKTELAGAK